MQMVLKPEKEGEVILVAGRACLHGISSTTSAGPGKAVTVLMSRVLVDGEICKLPGLTSDAVYF